LSIPIGTDACVKASGDSQTEKKMPDILRQTGGDRVIRHVPDPGKRSVSFPQPREKEPHIICLEAEHRIRNVFPS
jgi:hypothetical protein